MLNKVSRLAIALLLLIQSTMCLPRPSSSESEEDNTIPHGTSTTTPSSGESAASSDKQWSRLQASVCKRFENDIIARLQRTNKIAQDVLADPSMNSIDSKAMEEEKNELRKYVKDSKEALLAVLPADQNDPRSHFLSAVSKDGVLRNFHIFNRRRTPKTGELTPEQQGWVEAFKKHGILEYYEEMEKLTIDFVCQIVDDFDDYMKALPTAEKEKNRKKVEIWNMYKKNELGLSKADFGAKLFIELFQYDSES